MGDIRSTTAPSRDSNLVAVDPYALVQAILGSRTESVATETDHTVTDYDDLPDLRSDLLLCRPECGGDDLQLPKPNEPPVNVRVGAANPYALTEALLGRRIDRTSVNAASLLSQVLQTDYDELFDMRHRSVLFAGLQLDDKERRAEQMAAQDLRQLRERDLVTPDLSRVRTLGDLQHIGLPDLAQASVKHARIHNGKIRLVLNANANGHRIARQVTNRELTRTLAELMTPFRLPRGDADGDEDGGRGSWSPPNVAWRDMRDYHYQSVNRRLMDDMTNFSIGDDSRRRRQGPKEHFFDDPEQGAMPNSWFVAALFSVFWADPSSINRATHMSNNNNNNNNNHNKNSCCGQNSGNNNNSCCGQNSGNQHRLRVRFHDKGGPNNNRTQTVEVDYQLPLSTASGEPVYCRASDRTALWPALYEKAFAKWVGHGDGDDERPDLTALHAGDPVKAMAQLHGRAPRYYRCDAHSPRALLGVVRRNCVNTRTVNPMCAWTHATGAQFRGSTLVANHAYSVCGYAAVGDRQYIVLRNPWGVSECPGLTSYAGVLNRMDPELWQPAELLDQGGVFAMETCAFRAAFQYMGVCVDGP